MIIILGSTGYIGTAFCAELYKQQISYTAITRKDLNAFSENTRWQDLINKYSPSLIINCIGYTGNPNVDECETNKSTTVESNLHILTNLAAACKQKRIPLGHVSSGCIYNGVKEDGSGFTEEDKPNFCFDFKPCSFYSGIKAQAEDVLDSIYPEGSYIWRLRIPFDNLDFPKNYISKLLKYEKVYNNTNSISNRKDFVKACIHLFKNKSEYGKYNIVNTTPITTERVTELITEYLLPNKKFQFWKDDTEFYSTGAVAPRSNCVLDNTKLIKTGFQIPNTEDSIITSLQNWTHNIN